jgi:hypothetical protein
MVLYPRFSTRLTKEIDWLRDVVYRFATGREFGTI